MSRSIIVWMRKRAPHERIESYRRRVHQDEGHDLRDDLAAWVSVVWADLQDAWPDLPASIEDRNADVWEPLLAIADAAGGDWPARARRSAVALVAEAGAKGRGFGVQLLTDLRTIFSNEPFMPTEAILEALIALDESPWGDLRGKALDARNLARRLGKFDVKSKQQRVGERNLRGYERGDLLDAWVRYLPDDDPNSGPTYEHMDIPPPRYRDRERGAFPLLGSWTRYIRYAATNLRVRQADQRPTPMGRQDQLHRLRGRIVTTAVWPTHRWKAHRRRAVRVYLNKRRPTKATS